MRKLSFFLGLFLIFCFTFPLSGHAENKRLDSNSAVSFYGKYVPDKSNDEESNHRKQSSEDSSRESNKNLPSTGDQEGTLKAAFSFVLGFLFIVSSLYLKKKQERNNYER